MTAIIDPLGCCACAALEREGRRAELWARAGKTSRGDPGTFHPVLYTGAGNTRHANSIRSQYNELFAIRFWHTNKKDKKYSYQSDFSVVLGVGILYNLPVSVSSAFLLYKRKSLRLYYINKRGLCACFFFFKSFLIVINQWPGRARYNHHGNSLLR